MPALEGPSAVTAHTRSEVGSPVVGEACSKPLCSLPWAAALSSSTVGVGRRGGWWWQGLGEAVACLAALLVLSCPAGAARLC